jgi:hypothetical protein
LPDERRAAECAWRAVASEPVAVQVPPSIEEPHRSQRPAETAGDEHLPLTEASRR